MKFRPIAVALVAAATIAFIAVGFSQGQEPPPPEDVPIIQLNFLERATKLLEAFLSSGAIVLVGSVLAVPLRLFPKVKNALIPIVLGLANLLAVMTAVIRKLFEAQAGIVLGPEVEQVYYAGFGVGLPVFKTIVGAGWSALLLAGQRAIWEHGLRKMFPKIAEPSIELVPVTSIPRT